MFKYIIICFFISITFICEIKASEIKILFKVQNEIITNFDLENEKKYLLLINQGLKKININELNNIVINSIIKDKIKLIEIKKKFKDLENISLEKSVFQDFIGRIGYQTKDKFLIYINKIDLNENFIKKKIIFETLWNRIILSKFSKNIKIDENNLKKKIISNNANTEKIFEYNVSEILIDKEKSILNKVNLSINKDGFEATAIKYSNSETSKFGGKIGWVKSTMIAKEVSLILAKLKINELTNPIELQNGYLILKINEKREMQNKINLETELEKQIIKERNKQLNQFSNIFFKKLEQNIKINDYR